MAKLNGDNNMRDAEDKSPPNQRTVAVVGGIMALEPQYRRVLEEGNFNFRIYNQYNPNLKRKAEATDLIILFTATVSHSMATQARKMANACGIPLIAVRPSSVSALRKSISTLP
ncbi:MAG: DUF2325 domain-containing protein [Syntrophorhabdales bacterium]|jgi:hypothetical protein